MQKRSAKVWPFKINTGLRLLIAFALFGLTMEVCARIDDKIKYGAPIFEAYGPERLRTRDSDGIQHNVPNSRFEKWQINQDRFRGPDVSIKKREGVNRIVCMGTSETFGLYENPGQEWPAQLQNILSEKGSYEVINTSVVGLGLLEYLPYLQKYVLKFKPDIIIVLINPFVYVQQALSDRESQPKASVSENAIKTAAFQAPNLVLQRPRVSPKIKQSVKKIMPQVILKAWQIWRLSNQVSVIERNRLGGKSPVSRIPSEILTRFRIDLKRLVNRLAANDTEILLCTYPSLISEQNLAQHPEVFLDYRRFCITLSYQGMIDASEKVNDLIRAYAEERKIPFADVAKAVPKETRYFGDNVHYTDGGARYVASNIARAILKQHESL